MQSHTARTDIVIFGGGVAGLWLLNSLISKGFGVILFETSQLGNGQTIASQGIIHGGVKYALPGRWTESAESVSAMPDLWRGCFEGVNPIDLRGTKILSAHQYLWSNRTLTSRFTTLIASRVMKGRVVRVKPDDTPEIFSEKKTKSSIYRLFEPVIDVPSLLNQLANAPSERLVRVPNRTEFEWSRRADGQVQSVLIRRPEGESIRVEASRFIFAAGAGNAALMESTGLTGVTMQRRPLHMVLYRARGLKPLYAHAIGTDSTPRLTITTHDDQAGQPVWYIGGSVAEDGVANTPEDQIRFCRSELSDMLSWIDFSNGEWATFRVDRAEPTQTHGHRPNTAFIQDGGQGCLVAWPTKLALAPVLSTMIHDHLRDAGITPKYDAASSFNDWPRPEVATPPWKEDLQWFDDL